MINKGEIYFRKLESEGLEGVFVGFAESDLHNFVLSDAEP